MTMENGFWRKNVEQSLVEIRQRYLNKERALSNQVHAIELQMRHDVRTRSEIGMWMIQHNAELEIVSFTLVFNV